MIEDELEGGNNGTAGRRSRGDGGGRATLAAVFDALAHRRRRQLCRLVREHGDSSLEDLAMDIAALEVDPPGRSVTNYEWEGVYAALYHAHVPKLAELGVIEFGSDDETVAPGELFDAVTGALRAVEREVASVDAAADVDDE
ncbi:DUF7344 domain-containing protein [Halobaculum sp. EA56]|uniref:DUF7344 domain-containing protein n=1 Tax=Halobaculum sp. EA56 TaxID=3421648 RepID=UPI003EB8665E